MLERKVTLKVLTDHDCVQLSAQFLFLVTQSAQFMFPASIIAALNSVGIPLVGRITFKGF